MAVETMEVFFNTETDEAVEMPVERGVATAPASDEDKNKAKEATAKNIGSGDPIVVENLDEFIETDEAEGSKDDDKPFDEIVDGKTKKKVDKQAKKKTPSEGEAGSSSSSSPYSVLAKALLEEGVLLDYDPEEFNELATELGSQSAALMELHRRTIQEGIKADRESLTPLQKEYLEALSKGVPHETISTLQSFTDQVNSITPDSIDEDENVAKDVIEQALFLRGFSKEEVDDQIETAKSAGRLKTNAKNALVFLQKYAKKATEQEIANAETARANKQKEYEDGVKAIRTKLASLAEIVPGQKLSNKFKAELYDAITTPVGTDTRTGNQLNIIGKKRIENPIDFDIKIAYLIKTGFFDGNMQALTKTGKTAAINELEGLLTAGVDTTSGRKPSRVGEVSKAASTDVLESLKRVMKKG